MQFHRDAEQFNLLILEADSGLNADAAEEFLTALEQEVMRGAQFLIVDCSKLQHISSYGISVLLRAYRHLQSVGGQVRLAALDQNALDVITLAHLDRIFAIYPDAEAARVQ